MHYIKITLKSPHNQHNVYTYTVNAVYFQKLKLMLKQISVVVMMMMMMMMMKVVVVVVEHVLWMNKVILHNSYTMKPYQ